MDIIAFFRSIDGMPYYLMLVINTILIFAIIGYLGEKNNEKYVEMGMKMNIPNPSAGLNLNPITTSKYGNTTIPVVGPTAVDNQPQVNAVNNAPVQPIVQNSNVLNVNQNTNSNSGMFVNNFNSNINQTIQSNTNIEQANANTNEKAPAVLVINSDNTNMPK